MTPSEETVHKDTHSIAELYSCPFCGKLIDKDNILFVDESFDQSYEDTLRYNFLMNCSSAYPLDDMNKFRGLYYKPTTDNVVNRDRNDYPNVLQIMASEGLTPEELMFEPSEENETPPVKEGIVKPGPSTESFNLATRACPHCHCGLPNQFGLSPTIYVTLLGGRASGKTVFLIALLQQLKSQLTHNNLGNINILPESKRFIDPQIAYYTENQGVSMPTSTERLFPLVIEYTNLEKSCFIAIYDIAGEGIVNQQEQANTNYLVNHRGVKKANFVWLVLDPNQLNNGAFGSSPNGEIISSDHDMFTMPIESFLSQSIKSNNHLGILQQVQHVIAIMTKIDLPLSSEPSLFSGAAIIKEDIGRAHQNYVNREVLREVDSNVNTYLSHKLGQSDARTMIQSNFAGHNGAIPKVYMTAVSAYTKSGIGAPGSFNFQNLYHAQASKHRIIEPFLKLLDLSNMAPSPPPPRKDKGGGKTRWGLFGRR